MKARFASICIAIGLVCAQSFGQAPAPAGQFDFYLLTLSWSPEFCYSKPSAAQCSQHKGFVVHGLWPQNNDGTWPANCQTSQPAPTDTSPVTDIMPAEILQHEWEKHGTCSGLSGNDYFALIRRVFDSLTIPSDFRAPASSFTMRPKQLKQDFEHSNSALADGDMAVQVRRGYLNAVEICFTKDTQPKPAACVDVQDAKPGTFRVPPVR